MGGITQTIFSIIGSLLYPIFSIFFYVIDAIQNIFYSFAGLGDVTFGGRNFGSGGTHVDNSGGGGDNQNGIVYYLFRTETAKNILISMAILGVFLLIIFTVMAFIRNMYQAKQKRWQEIISSSLKGLINFLFLPVCCLLGVIAGNFLLQALNEATASSADITIGRQLFVTSAYNGNVFRDQWDGNEQDVTNLKELYKATFGKDLNLENVKDASVYAEYLDEIFKSKNGPEICTWWSVNGWYHLWNINYLMIAAGGVFLLFALIKISFGALKRLFMLVLLFVISPAVCSLYPLDDGSAVGKWRSKFIEQFFSVYGAVIGMNLFFDLVPLINSISLNGGDAVTDFMGLIPLLITIAGLYMVSDFINLITSLIPGAGNAYTEGNNLAGNVKRRVLQGTKATGKGIRKAAGAFSRAAGAGSARRAYYNEHKGEFSDTYTDATSGATRSLKREKGEKRADFKARKFSNDYQEAEKKSTKVLKKEAGTGFFGSIGSSLLEGTKGIGNTIMDKSGFGKLAKRGEGAISTGYRTGKETTEKKQKIARDGEFGEKKLIRAFKTGNFDEIYSTIQELNKAPGELGKKAWEIALKDGGVQAQLQHFSYGGKDYGFMDPKKVTLEQYSDLVTSVKRTTDAENQISNLESKVNSMTVTAVDSMSIPGGANDVEKSMMADYLRRGESPESEAEFRKKAIEEGITDPVRQQKMLDEMNKYLNSAEGKKYTGQVNTANPTVKALTAQQIEVVKGINTDNMSGAMADAIVDKLGELQNTFDRLDNGEKLVKLDTTSSTGFNAVKEALKEMTKKVTETIKNEEKTLKTTMEKEKNKKS